MRNSIYPPRTLAPRGTPGETELAQTNRALAPDLSTLFLPAEAHLAQVSSSALKERLSRGEDISAFCPAAVAARLRQHLLDPRSQT